MQCKLLLLLYYNHVQGRRPLNKAPLSALYKVSVRYCISIYILIVQPPGHSRRRNLSVPTFDLHLSTHSQMRKTCCATLVCPFPCNLLTSPLELIVCVLVKRFATEVVGPKVREMDENEQMDPLIINGLYEQGVSNSEIPSRLCR